VPARDPSSRQRHLRAQQPPRKRRPTPRIRPRRCKQPGSRSLVCGWRTVRRSPLMPAIFPASVRVESNHIEHHIIRPLFISHLTNSGRCDNLQAKVSLTVSPFSPSFPPQLNLFPHSLRAVSPVSTAFTPNRALTPLSTAFTQTYRGWGYVAAKFNQPVRRFLTPLPATYLNW
jgi:hypothetical protein